MAGKVAISEAEEERLYKLRSQLFDLSQHQEYSCFRSMVPSKIYLEDGGFQIYLGNADHAADLLNLDVKGITYILNMAANDPVCQITEEIYGDSRKCLRIAAGDAPGYDISQHFQCTFEFIEEARAKNAKVLVHCVAGASRSAAIVIAYLMQLHCWSFEKSAKLVRSRRAVTYPNVGFIKHLEELEKRLMKK